MVNWANYQITDSVWGIKSHHFRRQIEKTHALCSLHTLRLSWPLDHRQQLQTSRRACLNQWHIQEQIMSSTAQWPFNEGDWLIWHPHSLTRGPCRHHQMYSLVFYIQNSQFHDCVCVVKHLLRGKQWRDADVLATKIYPVLWDEWTATFQKTCA